MGNNPFELMIWFKRDPLVGVTILLSLLLVGFEGWLLRKAKMQAAESVKIAEQKKQERDNLQQQQILPTEETRQAIIFELASAREKLASAERILNGASNPEPAAAPAKSIDAYFEIADFVEKSRSLAVEAQVTIRPEEHFGFGSHASDGPERGLLPDVLRQRGAIQFLISALFETHPTALLSVQREYPLKASQREDRNHGRLNGDTTSKASAKHSEPADFFELPSTVSLRTLGMIDTDAFRLEFSGQTATLRSFLNRLSSCEAPFVVRSVEVEPLDNSSAKIPAATPQEASVPIVARALSRFRIIIELVRPLGETEGQVR